MEIVGAAAALECVVAAGAPEFVLLVVAGQKIVVQRAGDVLDLNEQIALRAAAIPFSPHLYRPQDDRNPLAGIAVIRHVDASVAGENVGAFAALEPVVIRPAVEAVDFVTANEHVVASVSIQRIVTVVADQGVIPRRAFDVLDADEDVARGIAAKSRAGLQVDGDPALGPVAGDDVAGRVRAVPAVEEVGAVAAVQPVVAVPAKQEVVVAAAVDRVVAAIAEDDVGIGLRVAALQDLGLVGSINKLFGGHGRAP